MYEYCRSKWKRFNKFMMHYAVLLILLQNICFAQKVLFIVCEPFFALHQGRLIRRNDFS